MLRFMTTFTVLMFMAITGCYHLAESEEAVATPTLDDEIDGESEDFTNHFHESDDSCQGIACTDNGPPVIYVDAESQTPGDGLLWETALVDVQAGIDIAHCLALKCDLPVEVWVAQGTHYVFATSPDDTIRLRPNVWLYGGFAGHEQSVDEREPGVHVTVLDGRAGPESDFRVRHVVIGSDQAVIDGFTIASGSAQGEGDHDSCGAGLLAINTSPTVSHCTFLGNAAGTCGGGGIYSSGGSPVVISSVFLNNTTAAGPGAGMFVEGGTLHLTQTVFLANEANGDGGGLALSGGTALIESCALTDNRADGYGGGVIALDDSTLELRGCELAGNAAQGGGAVATGQTHLEVINSVFYDNSAYWGGAYYGLDGHAMGLTNCTFTDNYAEEEGGAILQTYGGNDGATAIVGCIFWEDSPDEIVFHGAPLAAELIAFNNIQGGGFGADQGNIDADPLFVDPANDDYFLSPSSPCIDSADDSLAPNADMLGNPRVDVDNAGIDGTVADVGALEFQP